jgi:hypothetical protein
VKDTERWYLIAGECVIYLNRRIYGWMDGWTDGRTDAGAARIGNNELTRMIGRGFSVE